MADEDKIEQWRQNLNACLSALAQAISRLNACTGTAPGLPNITDSKNAVNQAYNKVDADVTTINELYQSSKAEKKIIGLAQKVGLELVDLGENDVLIHDNGSFEYP